MVEAEIIIGVALVLGWYMFWIDLFFSSDSGWLCIIAIYATFGLPITAFLLFMYRHYAQ